MTSDGSPLTRFRRSIEVRSVGQAEMAMREMRRVGLLGSTEARSLFPLRTHAPTRARLASGPVTSVETPATKTAVIRFQRAAHLKPDGLWGANSQAALDKMLHRH